jgi:hypothetical protein
MFKKITFPLVLLQFMVSQSFSQVSIKDSSIVVPMFYVNYSYQFPQGGLAERFGANSTIGGGFMIKTRSNWLFSAEGNYIFGSNVKNGNSLLKNISNSEGYVLDANGYYSEIGFGETGFNILAKFGKLFPILSPNPNSGPVILAGGGYMQDKIRIHDGSGDTPQIDGDYNKGYDRLNNGWVVTGTLGYLFLSDSRLINFFVGFEFVQAWTKYRRDINFDTGKQDNSSLSTQFYGANVKWMIPLYSRKPKNYYLY